MMQVQQCYLGYRSIMYDSCVFWIFQVSFNFRFFFTLLDYIFRFFDWKRWIIKFLGYLISILIQRLELFLIMLIFVFLEIKLLKVKIKVYKLNYISLQKEEVNGQKINEGVLVVFSCILKLDMIGNGIVFFKVWRGNLGEG